MVVLSQTHVLSLGNPLSTRAPWGWWLCDWNLAISKAENSCFNSQCKAGGGRRQWGERCLPSGVLLIKLPQVPKMNAHEIQQTWVGLKPIGKDARKSARKAQCSWGVINIVLIQHPATRWVLSFKRGRMSGKKRTRHGKKEGVWAWYALFSPLSQRFGHSPLLLTASLTSYVHFVKLSSQHG